MECPSRCFLGKEGFRRQPRNVAVCSCHRPATGAAPAGHSVFSARELPRDGNVAGLPAQLPALPTPHPAFLSLSSIPSLQLAAQGLSIPSGNLVTAPSSPRAGRVERDKTSPSLWSLVQINVSSSDQPPCTSTQPAGENQTSKGRKSPEQDIAIDRSSGDGDEMEN